MLKVFVHAHLTADPELRVTPKGTAIANFSVASNYRYKDDQGQIVEQVDYLDLQAFGKQGEIIAKNFVKGSEFVGFARLKQDRWEDKQSGLKRSRHVGVIDEFEFAGSKKSKTPDQGANADHPAEEVAAPR
jgi:single-strand DNA-binding protein